MIFFIRRTNTTFFFKWHINTKIKLNDIHMFNKWQYMSFNFERHIYTFHISFICLLIFNAHVNVMYHKQICRLQPPTSYHTVLGFPILARVTVHNFSKFDFIHVTFCVSSFRMDLLVQNDHLRDPLPDWKFEHLYVT